MEDLYLYIYVIRRLLDHGLFLFHNQLGEEYRNDQNQTGNKREHLLTVNVNAEDHISVVLDVLEQYTRTERCQKSEHTADAVFDGGRLHVIFSGNIAVGNVEHIDADACPAHAIQKGVNHLISVIRK